MAPGQRRFKYEPHKKVKKGTFTRLIKNILDHKIRLFFIFVGLVGSTVASVSTNLFIKILIDEYIMPMLNDNASAMNFTPIVFAIGRFACLLLVGIICSFMYHLLNVKLSNGILRDIREQMYEKMQKFPIKYFDTNSAGDIMSKYTNDLETLKQSISQAIPTAVMCIFQFAFIFYTMINLSIDLFIVVIIMCFAMYAITRIVSIHSFKNYRATQKAVGGLNGYVEEMIRGAKEVKVFCYEDRNIETFKERNKDWKEAIIRADAISNMMMPTMNGIGNILYVLLALAGSIIMMKKIPNYTLSGVSALTIGTITSFLSFAKTFSHMIADLSSQLPFITQSLSGAERIYDLIDEAPETDEGHVTLTKVSKNQWAWKDNDKLIPLVGNIVLENVNFSYVEGKPILKDINVYANEGQKVALVGATGAGKTTITNLINRFYEVDSGTITYDGINIKDIKKKDLRDSLSVVLQDVNLFTGTIMENIRYGKPGATDEECIAAARLACADKFIELLPDGYDTIIKGDSGGLSQGQKQLISIARAAVADPPCLILDEATSSIDTRTEKLVQQGMDSIMEGRTVFVIAHRLSTIKDADVIMVMHNGEIIERGDHDSLLEKRGYYYGLYTGTDEFE